MNCLKIVPLLKIIDAEIEFLESPAAQAAQYQCLSAQERVKCLLNLRDKFESAVQDDFLPMNTAPRDGRQVLLGLGVHSQYKFACAVWLPATQQWAVSNYDGQLHYFLENQCLGWAWLPYSELEYAGQLLTQGTC